MPKRQNYTMSASAGTSIRKSETVLRVLLVLGTVMVALALIELPALFNLIDYEALESKGVWGSFTFRRVPDPQLTHLEPPHAHYSGSSYGGNAEEIYRIPDSDRTLYRWDLKYDKNGFRNDRDLTAADTVFVGDSMLEGMTVSNAEVVTSVLAKLSGKTVANLGQYGYGPQQEMIVLKRYGLPLRPRTVVWMFFEGNDLTDAIEYRHIADHPPTPWDFFLQRSFSRMAYRAVTRTLAKPKPLGVTRSGIIREAKPGAASRIYFTLPAHALSKDELGAMDETARLIAEAGRLSADRQARFLFVYVPEKFRVYRSFCEFPAASECPRWELSDLPDRLRKAVTSASSASSAIGYLDLTPTLIDAAKRGSLPYYSDDVHWTPAGHRAAAEAIGDYLSSWSR